MIVSRTVAVDMRGYGESEKPSGVSAYTTDVMIEDVRQLIQALGRHTLDIGGFM